MEILQPRRRRWVRLTKPGKEEPLATSLAGARAWAADYERRGCKARLVELEAPRGGSYRPPPPPPPLAGQLALF